MIYDEKNQPERLWGSRDKDRREAAPPPRMAPATDTDDDTPPPLVIAGDRVYAPFENRSRPATLTLFCAKLPVQFPAYVHLANMSFEPHFGELFSLFYPFMTVNVTGKRLGEIVYAINARKCAIIREWHRDLYDPPERGIPVIEKIEFAAPARLE
jgi:hypothetical protein